MAAEVTVWKSEDGKLYEAELLALRADVAFLKPLAQRWLNYEKGVAERDDHAARTRQPYHERGGHQ